MVQKFNAAALAANQAVWCLLVGELHEEKIIDLERLLAKLRYMQQGLVGSELSELFQAFDRYIGTIEELTGTTEQCG